MVRLVSPCECVIITKPVQVTANDRWKPRMKVWQLLGSGYGSLVVNGPPHDSDRTLKPNLVSQLHHRHGRIYHRGGNSVMK